MQSLHSHVYHYTHLFFFLFNFTYYESIDLPQPSILNLSRLK